MLAVLLGAAAALKLSDRPSIANGRDAAFYYQIARRVSEGHGLQTTVSAYRQALVSLPARSNVYPLWPLALGAVGRVVPIERAGRLLPQALYLLDVALAYVVCARIVRRLAPERFRPFPRVPVNAAHVAAALLASVPVFFLATSMPYTEALAFGVLLSALLLVDAAATARSSRTALGAAAGAGACAGLAYLTRFQLVLAVVVVPLGIAIARRGAGRRAAFRAALLAGFCGLAAIAAEAAYLSTFPRFTPRMLLDWAAYHEVDVPADPEFEPTAVPVLSAGFLRERLEGLRVSLDPNSADSYAHSMGPAVYAPFLVLGLAFAVRGRARSLAQWLASPDGASVVTAILFGIALTLPAHLTPPGFWQKYVFAWRHGVTLLFLVVPAVVWLLTRADALPRTVGAALAAVSIWQGTSRLVFNLEPHDWPQKGLREAAAFLNARPHATALVMLPQHMSVFTENGLYWNHCQETPDALAVYRDRLPIDYVLLRPGEQACPAGAWLLPQLTKVTTLGGGLRDYTVYRWSNRPDPETRKP